MCPLFDHEWTYPVDDEFYRRGCRLVAGVDEVGRGALAGPVVTAAVILEQSDIIAGIRDSKKLTPIQRERLATEIRRRSAAFNVDFIDNEVVDRLNVLEATRLSMKRAVENLKVRPEVVLIDAVKLDLGPVLVVSIVKGDSLSVNVAAASIVAKVARDHWMEKQAEKYPRYGFERNKGYGTADHVKALEQFGPCPLHRITFRPVSGMA